MSSQSYVHALNFDTRVIVRLPLFLLDFVCSLVLVVLQLLIPCNGSGWGEQGAAKGGDRLAGQ